MLDYKLLQALHAVVQEQGFDKAARALHLTQSAVSHRVKLLEEQTGQILLVRGTPPCATHTGRQLIKHFLQVQSLEHDLGEALSPSPRDGFVTLSLGVNADSLATWFLDALHPLLLQENIVLDLLVEDQDITQQLLQNGDVVGCISAQSTPLQGCTVHPLEAMTYNLVATPAFIQKWFPHGVTKEAVRKAPAVIFNRKDGLHRTLLQNLFPDFSEPFPAHYIPSSEQFVGLIMQGHGYGVVPDLQAKTLGDHGRLIQCIPDHPLHLPLFWHTWSRQSELLKKFTSILVNYRA